MKSIFLMKPLLCEI